MTAAAAEAAGPLLTFRDVAFGYGRAPVLSGVTGEVAPAELMAVVGPNGAGKSTFLKGIVGQAEILAGSLVHRQLSPGEVAYLPQRAEIDTSFPIEVFDFVAFGAWHRLGPWGRLRGREIARIGEALAAVGLADLRRRPIETLSGGQAQRMLFARTIVQDARLILLDEPFAGIDERTTDDLLDVVSAWHREGRTVLAVLHDLAAVRSRFPTTLLLARAPVAWGPTASVLTPDRLARSRTLVAEAPEEPARARRSAGG